MRLVSIVLVCCLLLLGCSTALEPSAEMVPSIAPATPVPARPIVQPTPTPMPAAVANKRGVHLLLDDGGARWPVEVWREHVEWAARLVGRGGYVVQLWPVW